MVIGHVGEYMYWVYNIKNNIGILKSMTCKGEFLWEMFASVQIFQNLTKTSCEKCDTNSFGTRFQQRSRTEGHWTDPWVLFSQKAMLHLPSVELYYIYILTWTS